MPSDKQSLVISYEDLTFDELELIEETLSIDIDKFFELKQTTMLRVLAFVAQRRKDPGFTWEQAGSLTVSTITKDVAKPRRRPTPANGWGRWRCSAGTSRVTRSSRPVI